MTVHATVGLLVIFFILYVPNAVLGVGRLLFIFIGLGGIMTLIILLRRQLHLAEQFWACIFTVFAVIYEVLRIVANTPLILPDPLNGYVIPLLALTLFLAIPTQASVWIVAVISATHFWIDWASLSSLEHPEWVVLLTAQAAQSLTVGLAFGAMRLAQHIGEVQGQRETLVKLAYEDMLTGLPNRRAIYERIEALSGTPFTLLLLDVDDFKAVNDQYGHPVGDLALIHIAAMTTRHTPPEGTAGRWGGEEFMILLPGISPASAFALAEQMCRAVAATTLSISTTSPLSLTISVGVTSAQTDDLPLSVLSRVDRALYCAKHGGKNRVSLAPLVEKEPVD
jgi:diguanylate cyclase (GGDEF)-like protein